MHAAGPALVVPLVHGGDRGDGEGSVTRVGRRADVTGVGVQDLPVPQPLVPVDRRTNKHLTKGLVTINGEGGLQNGMEGAQVRFYP